MFVPAASLLMSVRVMQLVFFFLYVKYFETQSNDEYLNCARKILKLKQDGGRIKTKKPALCGNRFFN
jgi:hypothetical protein